MPAVALVFVHPDTPVGSDDAATPVGQGGNQGAPIGRLFRFAVTMFVVNGTRSRWLV